MTKQAFFEELNRLTAALNEQERARLLEYYGEMIDDRMEEGVPEEEAVAALGSPAALAKELADLKPAATASGSTETVSALRSLNIRVANADVTVVREPLENGAAAQVRFSDPSRFEWRMDGDTLLVQERRLEEKVRGFEFSLHWLKQLITEPDLRVTVALSAGLEDALDFEGGGSDLKLAGVSFAKAQLITASGDIELKDIQCAGGIGISIRTHSGDVTLTNVLATNLMAHAASGDFSGKGLNLSGRLRVQTASGDIELRDVESDEVSITSASGDIELDRGRTGTAEVRSASGDVRLDELETDPSLAVETASGDVDLTRCIARDTRVKTASGDVDLRLEPLPCGYDIAANSVSGSIDFDERCTAATGEPQPKISVRTVSGDIEARVVR